MRTRKKARYLHDVRERAVITPKPRSHPPPPDNESEHAQRKYKNARLKSAHAQRKSSRIAALHVRDEPRFSHMPLDHTASTFRLIRILPDKSLSGLIQCTTYHDTIEEAEYICLSYEWGPADEHFTISINEKPYPIRKNLFEFLENARKQKEIYLKSIWIDALCINQDNTAERNHQVQLMGNIYSRATEVWVWLGNDAVLAELFDILNQEDLISMARSLFTAIFDKTIGQPLSYEERCEKTWEEVNNLLEWTGFRTKWNHFCNQRYWTRAWIIQEIALARYVRYLAKDRVYRWNARYNNHTAIQVPSLMRLSVGSPDYYSLVELLKQYQNQGCEKNRDRIYSLLSLCREGSNLEVDYSISDADVMFRTLQAVEGLCPCYVPIIADVLHLQRLPEREVVIHNASAVPWKHLHQGSSFCSSCKHTLPTELVSTSGQLFCLSPNCRDVYLHFLWNEPQPGHKSDLYAASGEWSKRYVASLEQGVSHASDVDCHSSLHFPLYHFQLPLQILYDCARRRDRRILYSTCYPGTSMMNGRLLDRSMILYDPSVAKPPGNYLRVWEDK